ncbi:hypothetical protein BDY19DRAFT_311746 [Irpex rosettiformis]|uniref:Uncharacterized protein n=1 Tax=Irpex rosettiformis TaxID=378272 RepID=A0ACB8TZ28_9APHY|nr:hypothetical protein BDY19DRAFT_311746 [Irpex rosettiformis]
MAAIFQIPYLNIAATDDHDPFCRALSQKAAGGGRAETNSMDSRHCIHAIFVNRAFTIERCRRRPPPPPYMSSYAIRPSSSSSSSPSAMLSTNIMSTHSRHFPSASSFIGSSVVESYLDHNHLRRLAEGVLDIPESEDRFFTLTKPADTTILPLPRFLSDIYVLRWANPTRIGGGSGAAYSLDVVAGEQGRARTRHLYITYMDEAGPSRCRVALAKAIQQLGPILYTAEEDARRSRTVHEVRHGEIWPPGPHLLNSMDMDVDMELGMGAIPVPAAA